MAITVEELEIIIQAKVDKVVPQIRKMMTDVKKELQDSNIDFSSISNSINKEIAKTKPVIKKLKDEFNPEELDPEFIKKLDAMKPKIKGISNEYSKLTKKIQETNAISKKFETPTTNKQEYAPYITAGQRLQQMENSTQDVSPSSKSSSLWDSLRGKISLIKSAIQEAKADWNSTDGLLGQVRIKCSGILGTVKKITGNIATAPLRLSKMSNLFTGIKKNAESLKSAVSGGVKTLMKYAMALIGIRSIYNGLKSLASEWLNSNDSSAKQLKANLDYMKMAIGSTLKPVIETIINLIYKAISAVQSLIYALSGVNIFAKMTASNYKSMAKSAGSASKATKQLAGVHNEINNISDNNSGGGGGDATPNIDISKTDNKLTDWFKRLLNDAYGVGFELGEKLNEGLKKIPWDKIQATTKEIAVKTAQFLNGFIAGTDWSLVGYTIGQGINTALILAYNFLKEFDFRQLGNAVMDLIMGAIETIDWGMVAGTLSEWIKACYDFATGAIEKLDWHVIIDAILRFIAGIDFSGIADSFFTYLGTAMGKLVQLGEVIGEYINLAIDSAKQYFQGKIEECGGNIILGILKGIGDAVLGIGQWIIDHIFTPFIEGFKSAFGIHSPSTVMMEMGTFIMQGLFDGINSLVGKVLEIWENLKAKIVEITTNIKDKVKSKVQEMKESVVTKFNDLKTRALEKITNLKNTAVNTFDTLKNSISNKISNIKNTIVNGFESAVNYIKSLPRTSI